jgi:hypothetical protein
MRQRAALLSLTVQELLGRVLASQPMAKAMLSSTP